MSKATELRLVVWSCLQKIYLQAFCAFIAVNEGLCTESLGWTQHLFSWLAMALMVVACGFYRQQQSPDALESSQLEEEVDELSLIDHSEIMARLTLKQEVGSCRVCFHTLWFIFRSGSLCAQARCRLLFDSKTRLQLCVCRLL